jgi:phage-related minor tail protein
MWEARKRLIAAGIDPLSAEGAQILANTALLQEQIIQYEKLAQLKDNASQTANDIGNAFRNAMRSSAIEGKLHWKDAVRGIEMAFYDMLDRVMQQFVVSPLVNILTQGLNMGLNALFGGMGSSMSSGISVTGLPTSGVFANGGVAGPDGVIPFAGGGILNTPTRMMFGGTKALAGEGPGMYEALLPLRRGANGQLGVQSNGGGGGGKTEVTIIDQRGSNAEAVQVEERETGDGMRQISVMIRDTVKTHQRSGAFDADNKAAYGIGRRAQRR